MAYQKSNYVALDYSVFSYVLFHNLDLVVESLAPIQTKLAEYKANPDEVTRMLEIGREKAAVMAEAKMAEVNRKTGVGGSPKK